VIGNFLEFFIHDFINMIMWATALHQRVKGGDTSNTLAARMGHMGIEPMSTRCKGRGLTTRPDESIN
jgi:hypothetical protein